MPHTVTGPFTVTITPQPPDAHADGALLGRMTIDKQFTGPLTASSRGQMLTGMGAVKGSAGYVAMERVTGTLDGRQGSFTLQHSGVMNRGAESLTLAVVPDSGTDALAGLSGHMEIDRVDGAHAYRFTYTIASAAAE